MLELGKTGAVLMEFNLCCHRHIITRAATSIMASRRQIDIQQNKFDVTYVIDIFLDITSCCVT
jgi:hypothetical protein